MNDEIPCCICETLEQRYYRFLGTVRECCLCNTCFNSIDQHYRLINSEYRTCDICQQIITDDFCYHIGNDDFVGADICKKCKMCPEIDIRKMLVSSDINFDHIYCTERDYIYWYYGRDQLDVPESIKNRIVNFEKDDLDSVVRPPSYDWNAAKWQFIGEFYYIKEYDAFCCWAVRCEKSKPHQVASVVSDNHGRIAFNIFYQDIQSFLQAEKNYQDQDQDQDQDLNFAIYERLNRNLSMYYG